MGKFLYNLDLLGYKSRWVAWLIKYIVTEEDKRSLKALAIELHEIRKLIEQLAETAVNLSDKQFLKCFNASQNALKEKQVDRYWETLEKEIDIVEKEFQA